MACVNDQPCGHILTVRFRSIPQLKEKLRSFQELFELIPTPWLMHTDGTEIFTYGYKSQPYDLRDRAVRITGIGYKTLDVKEGTGGTIKLEIDNSGDTEYTLIIEY